MFALILAAMVVACQMLFSNREPLAAIESVLPFVWYWHIMWLVTKFFFWLLMPLVGIISAGADDDRAKMGGWIILAASPFVLFGLMLKSVLFLGGVYAIDSGIQMGEIVNQSHLVVGCILYGLAILSQVMFKTSSSSKND